MRFRCHPEIRATRSPSQASRRRAKRSRPDSRAPPSGHWRRAASLSGSRGLARQLAWVVPGEQDARAAEACSAARHKRSARRLMARARGASMRLGCGAPHSPSERAGKQEDQQAIKTGVPPRRSSRQLPPRPPAIDPSCAGLRCEISRTRPLAPPRCSRASQKTAPCVPAFPGCCRAPTAGGVEAHESHPGKYPRPSCARPRPARRSKPGVGAPPPKYPVTLRAGIPRTRSMSTIRSRTARSAGAPDEEGSPAIGSSTSRSSGVPELPPERSMRGRVRPGPLPRRAAAPAPGRAHELGRHRELGASPGCIGARVRAGAEGRHLPVDCHHERDRCRPRAGRKGPPGVW